MHSLSNTSIEAKYKNTNIIPTDEDYGGYIMREIEALGFSVKRFASDMPYGYFFTIDLLNGRQKAVCLCKSNQQGVTFIESKAYETVCSVKGAALYMVITNNVLLGDKARQLTSKGYFPFGSFTIGSDVLHILIGSGILPVAIGDYMIHNISSKKMAFADILTDLELQPEQERYEADKTVRKTASEAALDRYDNGECDELIDDALRYVKGRNAVTAGNIARILAVSMKRARRLLDEMTLLGVLSADNNGAPRKVLLTEGVIERRFNIGIDDEWLDVFGV